MTITEQKAAQRKAGIAARRALSDTERTRSNAALCARIMALDCFKKAETILLYAAFGGEADLSALAVEAARQGKTPAYPVCGEGFSLTAAVPGPDGWEVGAYGIRAPILSRSEILRPDQLDLVLVPCTAFDAACRRVVPSAEFTNWLPLKKTANSFRRSRFQRIRKKSRIRETKPFIVYTIKRPESFVRI